MAVANAGNLSPDPTSTPSLPRSSATFGPADPPSKQSTSSSDRPKTSTSDRSATSSSVKAMTMTRIVPEVSVNGTPLRTPRPVKSAPAMNGEIDDTAWGSNFWVTLVDPQTGASFFACPATGQVSWDPPVGNFVLPPNEDGEWWELSDESRGGLPYYYQTKSGDTVWERPEGFVIPLGIIQGTSLGRRLSQTAFHRNSIIASDNRVSIIYEGSEKLTKSSNRRSRSFTSGQRERTRDRDRDKLASPRSAGENGQTITASRQSQSSTRSSVKSSNSTAPPSPNSATKPAIRRSFSNDQYLQNAGRTRPNGHGHGHGLTVQLPPIPGSPYGTEVGTPPGTPKSRVSTSSNVANGKSILKPSSSPNGKANGRTTPTSNIVNDALPTTPIRTRSKSSSYVPHRSPPPQSLNAAVEMISQSDTNSNNYSSSNTSNNKRSTSDSGHGRPSASVAIDIPDVPRLKINGLSGTPTRTQIRIDVGSPEREPWATGKRDMPPSPQRPVPSVPPKKSGLGLVGKDISNPVLNHATVSMSPVQNRTNGLPIPIQARPKPVPKASATLASGLTYPILPHDLASDIQLFSESQYARQYFSTHRTGFIFKRTVPVAQMMTWQKAPLSSPLLTMNRPLKGESVKIFKVIQRIMGDRERDGKSSGGAVHNGSVHSLVSNNGLLEEERWLLGEGLTHGELRDEIYCQLMKQLSGNPHPESVFKGWQMLCVLLVTFPPSKDFETYLRSFIQQHTTHQEGRIDVVAKHCLRRLAIITKKGPRGKPPSTAEIETASDAAFNPSTFGESLDAIIRLQERNYPRQKVPIILPFLADGMLALGGTKAEGIFRVPGDGDSISELKLRIDRGYYTLDDIEDPHILASLLKLWLRELCDPLVPEELYNDCITNSQDPAACVQMVQRLPTINRRVVLFVVSFLQLFLKDEIQAVTKMTPANLALVMAPNLLRCNSDSMSVVFTNAQYEQIFVYNLLLHLKCNESDPDYVPTHGLNTNLRIQPPTAPQM
ncbi:hypothetical protein PILCRDRAFT_573568 [Piloderma croceum F 1598]|uniref:Rho-GAP domain-containing protein n=1 Tax=Piloderma croceum (strain F 1598) TaxID=765440 RepID=A0A0C3BNU3_PILCF|nr:hypothetical protein PILCRDRAFT_573568 [Piloderma croceum F 1598]